MSGRVYVRSRVVVVFVENGSELVDEKLLIWRQQLNAHDMFKLQTIQICQYQVGNNETLL